MKFGELEFFVVSDGRCRLDGGAMFGVVPKPLWSKKMPPDERNRITLGLNCLLIRAAGTSGSCANRHSHWFFTASGIHFFFSSSVVSG